MWQNNQRVKAFSGKTADMLKYFCLSLAMITAINLIISCTNTSSQDKKTSNQLISALNEANTTIIQATAIQMKSLEDKTMDFITKNRAEYWFKIAENVIHSTDSLLKIISTTSELNATENGLLNVYNRTLVYKSEVLKSDEQLAEYFESQFDFIRPLFSTIEIDSSNKAIPGPFVNSTEAILSMLAILKSKIKILENRIITSCNINSNSNGFWFEVYDPLISQNSNILSPGSSLEIRAGVGYFSTKTSPEIIIKNKTIPLLDSGYALYKIKVPEKEGCYQLPVFIKFLNLNTGKVEIRKTDIKYTVQKKYD